MNICVKTLDCSDVTFRVYFRSGYWYVVREDEQMWDIPTLEFKTKKKNEALKYVGLSLIQYMDGE